MQNNLEELCNTQQVSEQICKILLDRLDILPEFPTGDVPIAVAARVYGKDHAWVRAGIISGWLPIGRATRDGELITNISQMDSRYGKINYSIQPYKLWKDTGYIWKGGKSE